MPRGFHLDDGEAWRIALLLGGPGKAKKKVVARRSPTRPANAKNRKQRGLRSSPSSLGAVKGCSSPDARLFMPVSPGTPEPPGPPPCKAMPLPAVPFQTKDELEAAGGTGPSPTRESDLADPNMFYASGHSVLTAKISASAVSCPLRPLPQPRPPNHHNPNMSDRALSFLFPPAFRVG